MRKVNDIDFVTLLSDEKFLDLVKNTKGVENQLEVIEKEYPGHSAAIAYAIEFIKVNLSEQKLMLDVDAARIWENIREYSSQRKGTAFRRFVYSELWKVAAVLIVVLASSVFVYQRLTGDSLREIASTETVVDDEAMIILSDGSKHKLDANDTQIEYSADGGEVVVKKDQQKKKIAYFNISKTTAFNQIIVPFGGRHDVTLSDGTRVQLNSGSRLVFPAEFSGNTREVYLRGEGYFEVFKNLDKPFIVKTDFFDTKVLGTVFNISAYDGEQIASAVLVEGKVIVLKKNKLIGYTETKLSPGQGCFYSSATRTSDVRNVDVYDYVSWKDGLFLFKDKPLISVIQHVGKYYNKKIVIEGMELPVTLISGKLVLSDEIEEVMQYLATTLEARYEKNEQGIYTIKKLN